MNKLVIGLGTGRCGTRSLTSLFQEWGIPSSHEKYRLYWEPNKKQLSEALGQMVSDVGFYWLNYVDLVIEQCPDAKFICLKRNKERMVASFARSFKSPLAHKIAWINHPDGEEVTRYCDTVTQEDLDNMDLATRECVEADWDTPYAMRVTLPGLYFPAYDENDAEGSLRTYWDKYYAKSRKWQDLYPENFMIIDMNKALNTENGRKEIQNFIGISPNTLMQ